MCNDMVVRCRQQLHGLCKMIAAEFSAHFKVEGVKECLNDQKDQQNCGMFTACLDLGWPRVKG